jgi:hypothetical protein
MFSIRRLLWLLCLILPWQADAAECEPSPDMSPQELARHAYLRPQPASCELTQEQGGRFMWKLNTASAATWPYDYVGQCTPAKGRSYVTYGCQAPEGCAIFVGKDKLRIHVRKSDLACKDGAEP